MGFIDNVIFGIKLVGDEGSNVDIWGRAFKQREQIAKA